MSAHTSHFGPDAPEPHELTGLAHVDHELDSLAQSLAERYPAIDAKEILSVVRESYVALALRGRLPVHLVALTEHFARQRIIDRIRDQEGGRDHPPQVLFVCVSNAGRSQLAAALVRHYAGSRVRVRSAGSDPAPDIQAAVRELLVELHDPDASGDALAAYPKPLTDDAVRAADVVVTMGCGDVCPILPGKRYEDWPLGDPALASPAGVRAIRDELDTRVRGLLAELGVQAGA
jgi:arsenate reductase (thioredoxin)